VVNGEGRFWAFGVGLGLGVLIRRSPSSCNHTKSNGIDRDHVANGFVRSSHHSQSTQSESEEKSRRADERVHPTRHGIFQGTTNNRRANNAQGYITTRAHE